MDIHPIRTETDYETADLETGSPCHFCLNTLGKTPWTSGTFMKAIG